MKKNTCKAKTKTGARCNMAPVVGSSYCFTHDPTQGAKRAAAHKLGGARTRVKHGGNADALPENVRTIAQAMTILDYTLRELLEMENSIQRARALIALVGGYVDAVRVGELEARLIAIEAALRTRAD